MFMTTAKTIIQPTEAKFKATAKKGRSPNIVLAKCGVKYIIEQLGVFSRKKTFRST